MAMRLRSVLALASLLLAATPASAQVSAEAEATRSQLIADAQAAQAAGEHAHALELAQRALQLRATPTLWRLVAREQFALEQFAPALISARRCLDGATADPTVPERAATMSTCDALIHEISPHVGRVVITAPTPAPPGMVIRVGGVALAAAVFSVPYAVEPGVVQIDATASGRRPFHMEIRIEAGSSVPVIVTLPTTGTPSRATAHPPDVLANAVAHPGVARTPHPADEGQISPLVWIGGGVTLVAAATAIGLGVAGNSTLQGFTAMCAQPTSATQRSDCLSMRDGVVSELNGRSLAVNVLWGVAAAGAIGLGVGVFLSVRTHEHPSDTPVAVSMWVAPQQVGAQLRW